ncbi:hypothetical protein G9A89_001021 [Geosiphon pyriformis]|nr:hypothetical protein G9A89_001021 [Geosiphon pyriformis]
MKETKRQGGSNKKNGTMQHRLRFATKKPTTVLPPIPLPFPPITDAERLVSKISTKKTLARFPNAFIIYRAEYVQYLKSQGIHLSMTELSPMISRSWKQESEFVKDTYTRLSLQAEKLYLRRGSEQYILSNQEYYHPSQQEINDFSNTITQGSNFYIDPLALARPIAQRKMLSPNLSSNFGSIPNENFSLSTEHSTNQHSIFHQDISCSASTSPIIQLSEGFFESSQHSQTSINDFQESHSSNIAPIYSNIYSNISFNGNKLVDENIHCWSKDVPNCNINLAPIFKSPISSRASASAPQLIHTHYCLLPPILNNQSHFYESPYPLGVCLGNHVWGTSTPVPSRKQSLVSQTDHESTTIEAEIDEDTLTIDEFPSNFFDTLCSQESSTIKLPSLPIESFENYGNTAFLGQFQPTVSS